MPLIECPECQHRISDRAQACPQCGHPIAAEGSPSGMQMLGLAVCVAGASLMVWGPMSIAMVAGGALVIVGLVAALGNRQV